LPNSRRVLTMAIHRSIISRKYHQKKKKKKEEEKKRKMKKPGNRDNLHRMATLHFSQLQNQNNRL